MAIDVESGTKAAKKAFLTIGLPVAAGVVIVAFVLALAGVKE